MDEENKLALNEQLLTRCNDPSKFLEIKRMVQGLSKEKRQYVITEMLECNPYLATLCYISSDEDTLFLDSIKKKLKALHVNNLHTAIMLSLAYDNIGMHKKSRTINEIIMSKDELKKISSNNSGLYHKASTSINSITADYKDWENEDSYWMDLIIRSIIMNNATQVGQFIRKTNRRRNNMIDINNFSKIIITEGKKLFSPGTIVNWIKYVEELSLYEKLDELDFDYRADYPQVINAQFDKCYSRKRDYRAIRNAVRKITALGLCEGYLSLEYVKSFKTYHMNIAVRHGVEEACNWFAQQDDEMMKELTPNRIIDYWNLQPNFDRKKEKKTETKSGGRRNCTLSRRQ